MAAEFSVTFEGDHVKVVSLGDKSIEVARTVWTLVAETCQKHDCYKVLGIADSDKPLRLTEGYAHAEMFRDLGITAKYRIAWVELNPDGQDVIEFTETVLFNRGLPGRVFKSEERAREWLFEEDEA